MVNSDDLSNLKISPEAEATSGKSSSGLGKQELQFFDESRLRWEHQKAARDLGWLGKFFGAKAAPQNIAGVISILALLLFAATLYSNSPRAESASLALIGLASSALGYIFGSAKKA